MTAWNKPLPYPTAISKPYWDGLKEHKIKIQFCPDSGEWIFYPRTHCPVSGSRNLEWREVSGEAELYTYTTARIPTMPEFTDEMPQQLAVVKLKEGPHINTNLIGIDPGDIKIGMQLRPVFDERPGEQTILRFTSVGSAQPSVIQAEAPAVAEAAVAAAPAIEKRKVSSKSLEQMQSLVSEEWTDWSNTFAVTQEVINDFAKLSGDNYWIHTDPEKCKVMSPFGVPIAQGNLTLVLISQLQIPMAWEAVDFTNMVNYGSSSLRFMQPVPAGSKIHARSRVKSVVQAKAGIMLTMEIATHVLNMDKPSVLNEMVILYM